MLSLTSLASSTNNILKRQERAPSPPRSCAKVIARISEPFLNSHTQSSPEVLIGKAISLAIFGFLDNSPFTF